MRIFDHLVSIAVIVFALGIQSVHAQDAMFVDSSGNVGIGTNTPSNALEVTRSDGTAKFAVIENSGTAAARELFQLSNNGGPFFIFTNQDINQSYSFAMGATGHFLISHQQTSGVQMRLQPSGDLTITGSLNEGSSRDLKDNITDIDSEAVLAKLDELEISEWNYTDNRGTRHVGPMAEDFHRIYGLGPDAKHIAPKDLAGVALVAAKALRAENEALRDRVEQLDQVKSEVELLKAELRELKKDR